MTNQKKLHGMYRYVGADLFDEEKKFVPVAGADPDNGPLFHVVPPTIYY